MIYLNELVNPDMFADVTTIIFDCDGVLIDSYDANMFYYDTLKQNFGLPVMTQSERDFVHAHTMYESVKHIVPASLLNDALAYQKAFDYRKILPHLKRMDGLLELLTWLRRSGFKLAVNTSRTNTMDLVLSATAMEGFFYPVVQASNVRDPKPSPEGVHLIMDKLNVCKEEIAFIGDTGVDEKTAKNAGVRFWAYQNEKLDGELYIPDYWVLKRKFMQAFGGTSLY